MKLVLLDYSNLAHMAWAVNWKSPDPSATSTAIVAKVRELASGQPHVALCIDTGKSFRHDISADYKAHREARPQALYYNMDAALDVLRGDGFPVWGAAGYEADDVIAAAVHESASAKYWPMAKSDTELWPVLIVSADKDLAQLINERVTVFSPQTGKTRGLAEMHADFGIQPHQVVDFLALCGDAADNIKGAEGIGAKTAAKLLTKYGNLDDMYASFTSRDDAAEKVGKAVAESLARFQPRLAEVRSLLTLKTDAPIPFEQIFAERRPVDVATFGDDIDFAMQSLETKQMEQPGFPQEIIDLAAFGQKLRDIDKDIENDIKNGRVAQTVERRSEKPQAAGSTPAPATTLAVREPDVQPANVEWERQLEPRTMSQAVQLSQMMLASRLFSAYGSAEGVLATVLAGREMGFQSMASLRAFHIIENKPTLSAGAIHALVLRSGKAEYFRCTERAAEAATFVTKRKGEPEIALTFTIAEARLAWPKDDAAFAKSGWGRNPADMCVARALTKLARLVYPDVLNGLYAAEEFDSDR